MYDCSLAQLVGKQACRLTTLWLACEIAVNSLGTQLFCAASVAASQSGLLSEGVPLLIVV